MQDTTAPEFTFVCGLHRECSDEMPMETPQRQTTAERSPRVSSETTAGDAAGNYVIVRTLPPTTLKQLFGFADHQWDTHRS